MTKNVFYISAESLLLFHLSAEEGCKQQRTGAGSRAWESCSLGTRALAEQHGISEHEKSRLSPPVTH